ncbi:MAG: F0F1 ATP synthase subunit B [Dehalococcoidia bacterium]|nr:MAG: F0F1 ATP synthase subunit B [Dehalococcoidia bacterium]
MLDKLGIDVPYLVSFIVSFLLLLGLLRLVLYKPITRMLDQRSAKIKESLEQAEHIKQEAARSEETVKAQIEAGRKEGQVIVAQASQIAERVKEEARAEAREGAEVLIAKARIEIERERQEGFNQLRQEFVDLAILAAEKVINQSLDKKTHQRLIEEVLEESAPSKEG